MTQTPNTPAWKRYAPMAAIAAVAIIGAFTLKDYLSFEALAANREALTAFRDANYALTAGLFILAYIVIVGFSLPGATIATLTGGFLFATFPGAVVYTSVGAGLGEVFERGETPNLGIIFEPHILLPILGLCVLAALPIALKAVRGKKGL
jgi:uncharacterized membrane protein YdjX (TVP38/TMEM64 family)